MGSCSRARRSGRPSRKAVIHQRFHPRVPSPIGGGVLNRELLGDLVAALGTELLDETSPPTGSTVELDRAEALAPLASVNSEHGPHRVHPRRPAGHPPRQPRPDRRPNGHRHRLRRLVTDPGQLARYEKLVAPWASRTMDHAVPIRADMVNGLRITGNSAPSKVLTPVICERPRHAPLKPSVDAAARLCRFPEQLRTPPREQ